MENTYNIGGGTNYTSSTIKKLEIQNEHERFLRQEEHEHVKECKKLDQEHELNTLSTNLGFIGRIFGNAENATKNITVVICLCLILGVSLISCIVYFCKEDIPFIAKMWGGLFPIITLSLGYLFGKK